MVPLRHRRQLTAQPPRSQRPGATRARRERRKKRRRTCKHKFFGCATNPKVRNVLGPVVDDVLAKRLKTQNIILRDLLLDRTINPGRNASDKGLSRCVERKRENPLPTHGLWGSMLLPAPFRRLPEVSSGKLDLRAIRNGRVWLAGLIAFREEDFDQPTLQKYVGRMSRTSLTFVRTPPRWMVQRFISGALSGKIRYVSVFGRIGRVSTDPLFQRYAQCLPRIIRISSEKEVETGREATSLFHKLSQNPRIREHVAQLSRLHDILSCLKLD